MNDFERKQLLKMLSLVTAWDVELVADGENAFRLSSPFVFGNDGTLITFSLFFTRTGFYLCDNADHAMLANALGVTLDKDKIRNLNETSGVHLAKFDEGGEIQAQGELGDLRDALFDAVKLALALSFLQADDVGGAVIERTKNPPRGRVSKRGRDGMPVQRIEG